MTSGWHALAVDLVLFILLMSPFVPKAGFVANSRCEGGGFSSDVQVSLAEDHVLERYDVFVDWGCRAHSERYPSTIVLQISSLTEYDSGWNVIRTVQLEPEKHFEGSVSLFSSSVSTAERFNLHFRSNTGLEVLFELTLDGDGADTVGRFTWDTTISNWNFSTTAAWLVLDLLVAGNPMIEQDTTYISSEGNSTNYIFAAGTVRLSNSYTLTPGHTSLPVTQSTLGQMFPSQLTDLPTLLCPVLFPAFSSNETLVWRFEVELSNIDVLAESSDNEDGSEGLDVVGPTMGSVLLITLLCWVIMCCGCFLAKKLAWVYRYCKMVRQGEVPAEKRLSFLSGYDHVRNVEVGDHSFYSLSALLTSAFSHATPKLNWKELVSMSGLPNLGPLKASVGGRVVGGFTSGSEEFDEEAT